MSVDTFERFLEKDFDPKGYANNVIQSRAIGECLEKLADGVRLLDKELHSQVIGFKKKIRNFLSLGQEGLSLLKSSEGCDLVISNH